ncbi:MAG: cadherin repeat domain-containing protein [Pseudomonadales bacterium]|nr:cadherin repeat domain-containing protein [Pseudomonadales bacterium]
MRISIVSMFLGAIVATLTACGGGGGGGADGSYGSASADTAGSSDSSSSTTSSNAAPAFADLASTISVNENQTSITTVEATDADADALTFSLDGGDAQELSIDSETGVLVFLSAPDYETKATYQTDVVVSDGTTSTSQAITIEIVDIAETSGEAPLEINIIVDSGSNGYGGGNKYYINGSASPDITLEAGKTYRFLQSDSSNSTHPMRLSLQDNGTHGGGSAYTSNVDYVGSAGSSGAYLQFTVPADIDIETLYYYCQTHSGMGGRIFITAAAGTGYAIVGMN